MLARLRSAALVLSLTISHTVHPTFQLQLHIVRTKYTSHRTTSYQWLPAALHTLHKLPRGALHIVLVGVPTGLIMPLTTRLEAQCLGGFFCLGATLAVADNLWRGA